MSEFWPVYFLAAAGCLTVVAAGAYTAGRFGVDATGADGNGVVLAVLVSITPILNVIVPLVLGFGVAFFGTAWLLIAGVERLNRAGRARHQG